MSFSEINIEQTCFSIPLFQYYAIPTIVYILAKGFRQVLWRRGYTLVFVDVILQQMLMLFLSTCCLHSTAFMHLILCYSFGLLHSILAVQQIVIVEATVTRMFAITSAMEQLLFMIFA